MFFWFKRVPDSVPEQRESNLTVLYLLIIIILISYIIIKSFNNLIMENHPSQNWKQNSKEIVVLILELGTVNTSDWAEIGFYLQKQLEKSTEFLLK